MIDDKSELKEKKKRKKWPFFVFIPIISVWVLSISLFIIVISIEGSVREKEKQELLSDFEPFLDNSFCCYYAKEPHCFYYKNNCFEPSFAKDIVAISESQLILLSKNGDSFSAATKTEILVADWDYSNEKTLLSLGGDYDCCELSDGKHLLTNHSDNSDGYLLDFENGSANKVDSSFKSTLKSETIGNISFSEDLGYYSIKMPYETTSFLMVNNIDSTIMGLMQKWSFKPDFCQKMFDGSICCAFYKNNKQFGTGQTAVLLMKINDNSSEISYQIVFPDGIHQFEDCIFDIYPCFSKELSLK